MLKKTTEEREVSEKFWIINFYECWLNFNNKLPKCDIDFLAQREFYAFFQNAFFF